jgi:hypothetical protein
VMVTAREKPRAGRATAFCARLRRTECSWYLVRRFTFAGGCQNGARAWPRGPQRNRHAHPLDVAPLGPHARTAPAMRSRTLDFPAGEGKWACPRSFVGGKRFMSYRKHGTRPPMQYLQRWAASESAASKDSRKGVSNIAILLPREIGYEYRGGLQAAPSQAQRPENAPQPSGRNKSSCHRRARRCAPRLTRVQFERDQLSFPNPRPR